ncbi:MAG: ribonuclease R [Paludibacteraceae bacterium]|nr:ribonuclease R [Paludibacteraceae bacterium]MBR5973433.1 ribonuclease R [Paludibacteraceae bacterium]
MAKSNKKSRASLPHKRKQKTKSSIVEARITKQEMLDRTVKLFEKNPSQTYNYKQVAYEIGVTSMLQKRQLVQILEALVLQDYLKEPANGKYRLDNTSGSVIGKLERRTGGKIFLVQEDDPSKDVFIMDKYLNRAIVGDIVRVRLFAGRKGQIQEGQVLEVLQRGHDTFVGKLDVKENYAFLQVDDRLLTNDIFIPVDKLKGGKNGDKAVVKIVEWEKRDRNPVGEVLEVLGASGDNETEMHAILLEFGLPYSYPSALEDAANEIPEEITEEEVKKRLDCREIPTFTIDPRDAKDFDDALSVRKLSNGNWEVGVHIADVTHYVKVGDSINEEAYKRATSVYLVDRTIPMLPERLSNQLCSLRPDEEKLCYSVMFEMDDDANVLKYKIVHTVIKSNRRFTYEEAQSVIETQEGDMKDEILALDALAKKLRERRFKSGAIAFERTEVRFEIDEKGKPLSVYFKESQDANKLIEEFMLLANRTVSEHIGKKKKEEKAKTFIYRVHAQPDPEKLNNLSQFISKFGYKLKTTGKDKEVSTSINQLLNQVQGKKEQNLIETITIRSMAKAEYSTDNCGHYGLAFDFYTHFTSPIRRYPDMIAHRLLDIYADGGKSVDENVYEDMCKHCSEMEQLAANAERASIKYKQVEFMQDKVGQTYNGVISGIQEWGIYVELNENKCEGMIPIRDLDDDYYSYDEKNYCLVGKKYRRTYSLGDEVVVRIKKTNLDKKQMDFEMIERL